MKIAYGYNVSPNTFEAHQPDSVIIDTPATKRANRSQMFLHGLRDGDTLLIVSWANLARGGELPPFRRTLAERNVPVEVVGLPDIPARPRGRPNGLSDLTDDDDKTVKAMWKDPVHYTRAAVVEFVAAKIGTEPTRNQMHYRYGART